MPRYWDWGYSRARPPKGGIRSQSQRGAFGESWWSRRWIEALERFTDSSRLSRGRSYARHGHVLSIEVAPGRVKAEVQGSRRTPYKVVLKVPPLFSEAIPRLSEALSHQALYVAQLLAGQMPPEIEKVFSAVGLSLFPTLARDLETSCTCPDWGNPCKHVAAVFYLLGEEFDRDPFQLFTLRGLSTEALLGSIQTSEPEEPDHPEPLDPTGFWGALDSELGRLAMPREASTPLPILQRLGPLPFWRGQDPLAVELGPDYATAAHRARNWFEGESGA